MLIPRRLPAVAAAAALAAIPALTAIPASASIALPSDWSGYVDVAAPGVQFTHVQATFTVPAITTNEGCTDPLPGYGAFQAVGIDGPGTLDNEEVGVTEIGCNGVTTADFFYNVAGFGAYYYPGPAAGDTITAAVTVNSNLQYVLKVSDITNGKTMSWTMGCQVSACPNTTAEVLTEPGNLGGAVVPDFGKTKFTQAHVSANFGAITGTLAPNSGNWASQENAEASPSLIRTSGLYSSGKAFTTTWVN